MLVFWNPGCGFCQSTQDDLRRLASSPESNLIVISSGERDGITASLGDLDVPILLDPDFRVGPMFGASGTPSAVSIRPDLTIGSGLAVGGPKVLALAGGHQDRG